MIRSVRPRTSEAHVSLSQKEVLFPPATYAPPKELHPTHALKNNFGRQKKRRLTRRKKKCTRLTPKTSARDSSQQSTDATSASFPPSPSAVRSLHDLFETYLPQYEAAFVRGGATGAMCAYNAVNGAPACANDWLLNRVLRRRWRRPDAHIASDCDAIANLLGPPANASTGAAAAALALNNGADLETGSTVWDEHLLRAVDAGLTSEANVTAAWRRGYLPHFRAGRFDPPERCRWTAVPPAALNSTLHQRVQYEAALQSLVLLRNVKGKGLPLRAGAHVAVLGPMRHTREGLTGGAYAGDQFCWDAGLRCIPTVFEAVAAANAGGRTVGAAGVGVSSPSNTPGMHAALALGRAADVVVLVLGIDKVCVLGGGFGFGFGSGPLHRIAQRSDAGRPLRAQGASPGP